MRLYKRVPDTDERGHTVVYELATDSEIAAAHPKCGTCGHFDRARSPAGLPLEWGYCGGGIASSGCEPYKDDPADLIPSITDYCPHHTEITGAPDETE